MHLLQYDDFPAFIHALCSGYHARCAGTDHADVTFLHDLFVRTCLGFRLVRICDTGVVADFFALAAGDALVRIDPVLAVSEGDCVDRTFRPALMTSGAEFLIDNI